MGTFMCIRVINTRQNFIKSISGCAEKVQGWCRMTYFSSFIHTEPLSARISKHLSLYSNRTEVKHAACVKKGLANTGCRTLPVCVFVNALAAKPLKVKWKNFVRLCLNIQRCQWFQVLRAQPPGHNLLAIHNSCCISRSRHVCFNQMEQFFKLN